LAESALLARGESELTLWAPSSRRPVVPYAARGSSATPGRLQGASRPLRGLGDAPPRPAAGHRRPSA